MELAGNDLKGAEKTVTAAQRMAPDNPWVYIVQAQLLRLQSKSDQDVEQALDKSFACKTQDALSLAECAKLYAQIGHAVQSKKCTSESEKIRAAS